MAFAAHLPHARAAAGAAHGGTCRDPAYSTASHRRHVAHLQGHSQGQNRRTGLSGTIEGATISSGTLGQGPDLIILGQITIDDVVPATPAPWQRQIGGSSL